MVQKVMRKHEHVDQFIDDPSTNNYAAFVLYWFRAPACHRSRFDKWLRQFRLFCTYEGKRYRVTGASTMGDVQLTADFKREMGYDSGMRVDVDACSEWSCDPAYEPDVTQ